MNPSVINGNVSFLAVEAAVAFLAVLVSLAIPDFGGARFAVLERWGARLANRPVLALVLVGIAAPLIRLALLGLAPIPQPAVHDEFSHLLAADTFASGRITNPTHPMWQHFETFHVDQQPTYMSMYFPAQGLVLAAGKVLFGHPWYGVVLSVGAMCAAIYWMLLAWLPPGWALLGGVLVVLRLGVFSYWMNSYWGGAVAATGGALVLGALPRLMEKAQARTALLLGFGVALLANSRPYEGVLLSLPAAAVLLVWMVRKRLHWRMIVRRVAAPLCVILLAMAAAMGYYNFRVFGSPWILPYQINRATYAVSPYFVWQSPRPEPPYRHKVMRDFYVSGELPAFLETSTLRGFLGVTASKAVLLLFFFLGAVLVVPLLMLPRVMVDRRNRFLLISAGIFCAGLLPNAFFMAHYFAPATGLLYALLLLCMREVYQWRPAGRLFVRLIPGICVALCAAHLALVPAVSDAGLPRAGVQSRLAALPGNQLAVVRYSPEHPIKSVEWVYNAADIDRAKVVWAREMDPAANLELVRYFKDRKPSLVEPDQDPPRVTPYVP